MQPLLIVHVVDKPAALLLGIAQRFVLIQISLLTRACLEEALGLGVVGRVARGRHADLRATSGQAGTIGGTGILDAALRVMDEVTLRLPQTNGCFQRRQGQMRINRARQVPADATARPAI